VCTLAQHFERLPSKGNIDGGIANLGGTGTAKEEEERAQTCKFQFGLKIFDLPIYRI